MLFLSSFSTSETVSEASIVEFIQNRRCRPIHHCRGRRRDWTPNGFGNVHEIGLQVSCLCILYILNDRCMWEILVSRMSEPRASRLAQ
ncbi:hypothetical protein BDZ45DRAFT_424243 [Acephala macrosclerotiorum]|nr:hypothetical protein BDZ45DRAFT_424243 [Acephala macrosclerotiorum]